jgi:hypothetical protein
MCEQMVRANPGQAVNTFLQARNTAPIADFKAGETCVAHVRLCAQLNGMPAFMYG